MKHKKRTAVLVNPDTRRIYMALVVDGNIIDQDMSVEQARTLYLKLGEALSALEN